MSDYYSTQELLDFGFESVGKDVRISRLCKIYSIKGFVGDGTRIDDYTMLKGHIEIGRKVHICSHCSLSGVGGKITIGDLCGIGVNNIFYTASDDSTLAQKLGPIELNTGVALGGRVTIMPNTKVGEFSAFGISAILSGQYDKNSVYMVIKGSLKKIASRDGEKLLRMAKRELD